MSFGFDDPDDRAGRLHGSSPRLFERRPDGDEDDPADHVPEAASSPGFSLLRSLKRQVLASQSAAWEEGRPVPPEELLNRWPRNPSNDPDAASVLVEDFFQRRLRGEEASVREYQDRFPDHARSFAGLVARESVMRSVGGVSSTRGALLRLPEPGDEVFGFRLESPLGKGAFAQVFLAEQKELADRPVVIKVSAIEGTEPQTLAQLQHTHIVPIYSVHEDQRAGLRAVCMPYFGGASLSAVLREVFSRGARPVQGRRFVAALHAVESPPPAQAAGLDPSAASAVEATLQMLAGMSYVQATIWVVARLAEGLQHAHERGVLHRDIKPSNILISAEGQPLLLDFNLSHDPRCDPAESLLGGTVAYMAPEHLRALAGSGSSLAGEVDRRSDVYSLGMVAAEMLTGHNPFEQSASYSVMPIQIEAMALERSRSAPSLRRERVDIPWGLESIVRTCLAPDADDRYQQAAHLAEDLQRLLDDRPLRYAPELSRVEQARKWARRHSRLATAAAITAVAAVALLAVSVTLAGVRRHLATASDRLVAVRARDRLQAHDEGTLAALCLVNTAIDRQDHLREGARLCERTLALFDPPAGAKRHPDWDRLAPADRARVADDRRELMMLLAAARVRLAPAPGDPAAVRDALGWLERAEAEPGLAPSSALWLDRARYLALLGEAPRAAEAQKIADAIPAGSPRDHYLLATAHARRGGVDGLARAVTELNAALELNPRHYWSLVQRGICRIEQGQYLLAAGDFGQCAGLRPELSWGYFNRGYVADRMGLKEAAVADYSAALVRDPRFVPAWINRGLALLELRRFRPSLADFDRAAALSGEPDATVQAGRGMALEGLGRAVEADAAFDAAFRVSSPGPARRRLLWSYGFAVARRAPEKARGAFESVLRDEPGQPQALFGLARLAEAAGDESKALVWLERALVADPEGLEARRGRAVLLARRGEWDRAGRDINRCLERDPQSGETLYAAACVAALGARALGDPQAESQALSLLRQALARGVGSDRLAADPDLASLRRLPDFPRPEAVSVPVSPVSGGG